MVTPLMIKFIEIYTQTFNEQHALDELGISSEKYQKWQKNKSFNSLLSKHLYFLELEANRQSCITFETAIDKLREKMEEGDIRALEIYFHSFYNVFERRNSKNKDDK